MRRIAQATLLFTAASAGVAPAATQPSELRVNVSSAGKSVRATAGSWCITRPRADGTPFRTCRDLPYPLHTRGRLKVSPGSRVTLGFAATPATVKARLLAGERDRDQVYEAVVVKLSARRYRLSMPQRLPCGRVLDVYATYDGGDVDLWAAVSTPGCVSTR
jgi:hypothetical protein